MNKVAQIIESELHSAGVLPFWRFMQLALYCPDYGYYETEKDRVGSFGDFFTSVSVGSLFGDLLACRFASWLERLEPVDPARPCLLVEAGAHDGRLASDILTWLQHWRPELSKRLHYCFLEPSARRRAWQQERVARFSEQVSWVADWPELTRFSAAPAEGRRGIRGIIFSNELLDAFPVHRVGWDARQGGWFEWGVCQEGGLFQWKRIPPAPAARCPAWQAPQIPQDLARVLPDGFTIELCPEAAQWWQNAASVLQQGWLLTMDYGLEAEEVFRPERGEGTLRAYAGHQVSKDLLARPGEQDLTAHVNFSELRRSGEAVGLQTEGLFSQEQFLTVIAAEVWTGTQPFAPWSASLTRQFQTLTHPQHLGRAFRVLVQSRLPTLPPGSKGVLGPTYTCRR